MVARGDLGVQIDPERVFIAQKRMIARANIQGKPVICATQMLESMIHSARPTRAECGDVATAVLDGTDAVMLSGETAKGQYPVEAISMMSRICQAAEAAYPHRTFFTELTEAVDTHTLPSSSATNAMIEDRYSTMQQESLASAAVHASIEINAAMILVVSVTGRTAALISKYRPTCPILALTSDSDVARRLQVCRGVQPCLIPDELPVSQVRAWGIAVGTRLGLLKPNDSVVTALGVGVMPHERGLQVSIARVPSGPAPKPRPSSHL